MLADPDQWQDPSTSRSSFAKGTRDLRTAKVSRIPAKPRTAARPYPPPQKLHLDETNRDSPQRSFTACFGCGKWSYQYLIFTSQKTLDNLYARMVNGITTVRRLRINGVRLKI
jgi:hypothetical protein